MGNPRRRHRHNPRFNRFRQVRVYHDPADLCYGIFGVWKAMPGVLLSAIFFSITSWSIPAVMAASMGDLFGSRTATAVFALAGAVGSLMLRREFNPVALERL